MPRLSTNQTLYNLTEELYKQSIDVDCRESVFPDEKPWIEERLELIENCLKEVKKVDKKYGFDELLEKCF